MCNQCMPHDSVSHLQVEVKGHVDYKRHLTAIGTLQPATQQRGRTAVQAKSNSHDAGPIQMPTNHTGNLRRNPQHKQTNEHTVCDVAHT
jgi:hypothetical protein